MALFSASPWVLAAQLVGWLPQFTKCSWHLEVTQGSVPALKPLTVEWRRKVQFVKLCILGVVIKAWKCFVQRSHF